MLRYAYIMLMCIMSRLSCYAMPILCLFVLCLGYHATLCLYYVNVYYVSAIMLRYAYIMFMCIMPRLSCYTMPILCLCVLYLGYHVWYGHEEWFGDLQGMPILCLCVLCLGYYATLCLYYVYVYYI